MKKLFLFSFIFCSVLVSGQVVNFAKTLPVRTYSIGFTPSWYIDNANVGLRSIGVDQDQGGALALGVAGGYSLQYSLDLGAKFIYVMGGKPYVGIDLQYLVYEARKAYVSVIGGLHYWDNFGLDLTGLFTYWASKNIYLSTGLDIDVNVNQDMENGILARAWIPVNIGFSFSDYTFFYAEYDLQVSEWSWGIMSAGVTFIFR